MNFADAIRKAASDPGGPVLEPNTNKNETTFTQLPTNPDMPEAAHPNVAGNVVRLELFLTAEQMSGMLRAIMAGQHTVLTAREAAAYLRVSQDLLLKMAENGEIPGILIEGRWRFPKSNLEDWLTSVSIHAEDEDVA